MKPCLYEDIERYSQNKLDEKLNQKHHKVLESMTSTLKGALTWTRFENAIEGLHNLGQQKDEILNVTEEFIRAERKEIVEYRKLMRPSKRYYQGSIHAISGGHDP
jgi:hypothetical protein